MPGEQPLESSSSFLASPQAARPLQRPSLAASQSHASDTARFRQSQDYLLQFNTGAPASAGGLFKHLTAAAAAPGPRAAAAAGAASGAALAAAAAAAASATRPQASGIPQIRRPPASYAQLHAPTTAAPSPTALPSRTLPSLPTGPARAAMAAAPRSSAAAPAAAQPTADPAGRASAAAPMRAAYVPTWYSGGSEDDEDDGGAELPSAAQLLASPPPAHAPHHLPPRAMYPGAAGVLHHNSQAAPTASAAAAPARASTAAALGAAAGEGTGGYYSARPHAATAQASGSAQAGAPLHPFRTGAGPAAAAAAASSRLSSSRLSSGANSRSSSVGTAAAAAAASSLPTSGPGTSTTGLQNLGNTCYMNSTLQCLAHIQPLAAFFSSAAWGSELVPATTPRARLVTQLASSFGRLLKDLSGAHVRYVSPLDLRRLAGSALSEEGMFSGSAQNDAHELLRFFLDALREALNRIRGRAVYRELKEDPRAPDAVLAERYWRSYQERDSSVVGDIFRGQLRSVMTCGTCGYTSRSFEPFEELMLQLGRGVQQAAAAAAAVAAPTRVEQLLQAFVQPETLSGEEAWRCDACQCPRQSSKQISIYKAPPVLILVLKRFSYTRLRRCKVDTPVCIAPRDPAAGLLLAPFMCASGEGREGAVYDLVGCVNHSGGTHGGHYTADCRVGGKGWHNFNDAHAHAIPDVGVSGEARREPYVLFYERRQE